MEELILEIVNNYGYIGICLIILLENIFPILPGVVIIFLGGYFSTITNISVIGVIISSTIGSLFGAIILYNLGKILNKEKLKKMVKHKNLKILRIKSRDIEKCDKWFDTKGNKSVFYGRFIPVIRSVISIPAGMSEMPFNKFLLYTISGSICANGILAILGYYAGDKKDYIINIIDKVSYVFALLIILIIIYYIYKFYKNKRR